MIRFLYFDLGNVLLFFNPDVACLRMAEVANVPAERIKKLLYESRLMETYELGWIRSHEWYLTFCYWTQSRPDYHKLLHAAGDMFEPNEGVWQLVRVLKQAGWRLGILSNTCDAHWQYCRTHYAQRLALFDVTALSFQLGVMKPAEEIFRRAAQLARARPEEIFFVDDRPEHVASACCVGFDAVRYESVEQLRDALRQRRLLT